MARKCAGPGLIAVVAFVVGCGSNTWIVKRPVADQCSSAGVKQCDELVNGLVQYIDSDKAGAEVKLRAVAKANSPEKLRTLTAAIKPATKVLGSERQAAVDGVIDILEGREPVASEAKAAHGSELGAAVGLTAGLVKVRTGMASPAGDPRAIPCDAGPLAVEQDRCRKVRAIVGPITVTNIYASGACPDEVFAFAGRAENPHWFLGALPNAPLNVSGAFAVEEGEELFVGVRSLTKDPPTADARCSIVWSGVVRSG